MDESQMDDFDEASTAPNSISKPNFKQDSLAFLRGLPAPDLPPFVPTMTDDSQDVVADSQIGANHTSESQSMETQTQGLQLGFSQSQIHGFDSLVDPTATQFSEVPDATQDVGFQNMTPIRGRFVEAPPSTVDTVVMGQESPAQDLLETPVVKKKGKLRRRAQVAAFSDEEDAGAVAGEPEQEDEFEISANVFDVMRKASKKKETVPDEFDKKTSKAKEMVHDQAEESEDDYAGLGGASDEGSDEEEDEYVKEMIDDEGGKDVDESKLAAFFA
jgi:mediator of replication checkpoint protein 1